MTTTTYPLPPVGTDARAIVDALYLLQAEAERALTQHRPGPDYDSAYHQLRGIRSAIACARVAFQDTYRARTV